MAEVNFNSRPVSGPDPDKESDEKQDAAQQKKDAQRSAAFRESLAKQPASTPQRVPTPNKQAMQAKLKQMGTSEQAAQTANEAPQTASSEAKSQVASQQSRAASQASYSTKSQSSSSSEPTKQMMRSQDGGTGGTGQTTGGQPGATADQLRVTSQYSGGGSGGQQSGGQQESGGQSNTPAKQVAGHTAKQEAARDSASPTARRSDKSESSTLRIDAASIVPSFPAPHAPQETPLQPVPSASMFNAQAIQQMVQFAAVGKTPDGQSQFMLGFNAGALAGVNVCLTACGRRRVKLRFSGLSDAEEVGEAEVGKLVDALRRRNVEVVEVEMD